MSGSDPGRAGRRPGLVTWLSVGVVIFAGVHIAGLRAALALPDLPFAVPRLYLAIRNALWGFGELLLAIAFFLGLPPALPAMRWGAAGIALWYWADRLLLTRSEFVKLGLPQGAAFTALVLVAVFWVTSRSSVQRFFEEIRT